MVMQAVIRSLTEAESCGRHARNALPDGFVLTPPALCGDCMSLGWEWRFDATTGWHIARDKQDWMND
jgi:hypothetical protein